MSQHYPVWLWSLLFAFAPVIVPVSLIPLRWRFAIRSQIYDNCNTGLRSGLSAQGSGVGWSLSINVVDLVPAWLLLWTSRITQWPSHCPHDMIRIPELVRVAVCRIMHQALMRGYGHEGMPDTWTSRCLTCTRVRRDFLWRLSQLCRRYVLSRRWWGTALPNTDTYVDDACRTQGIMGRSRHRVVFFLIMMSPNRWLVGESVPNHGCGTVAPLILPFT